MITSIDHIVMIRNPIPTPPSPFTRSARHGQRIQTVQRSGSRHGGRLAISSGRRSRETPAEKGRSGGVGAFAAWSMIMHPGSDVPIAEWQQRGPKRTMPNRTGRFRKTGAMGPLWSFYVRDPDGTPIEISNQMQRDAATLESGGAMLEMKDSCQQCGTAKRLAGRGADLLLRMHVRCLRRRRMTVSAATGRRSPARPSARIRTHENHRPDRRHELAVDNHHYRHLNALVAESMEVQTFCGASCQQPGFRRRGRDEPG